MLRVIVATTGIHMQQYVLHREFWVSLIIGKILPVLVPLLVWMELFRYTGADYIEGWSRTQMLSYYVIIFVIASFTRINFHHDLSQLVHQGKLNEWLTRPLSFFEMAAGMILARVIALFLPSIAAIILCFFIFPEIFLGLSVHSFLAAVVLMPFSILMLAALSGAIGMLSFWLIQTDGTFALMMMVFEFFGGSVLPLSLLPYPLQILSAAMPLRFAIYLPAQSILGDTSTSIPEIFAGQVAWIAVLLGLAWFLSTRGLKRYDAVGG